MAKRLKDFFSKREVIIFLIFFSIVVIFAKTEVQSWAEASRMATIESLVERGTFIIDDSSFNWTKDKVYLHCPAHPKKICGHYYSEKPPVLSFVSAGLYFILYNIFGITLSESYFGYYLLNLLIIGTSFSLLMVFFYKSLGFTKIKERIRIIITLSLGIGTLVLSYSILFFNHIVSATLLFISFYILLKLKFLKNLNIKKNIFLMGLLISFATTVEYSCGVFLILFFIYILFNKNIRYFIPYFILGIAGPLTLHFILNYIIFGSFSPAYLMRGPYYYKGSPWPYIGANKPQGIFTSLRNILIGEEGLFIFNPVLIIPFLYLLGILFDKDDPLRKESWLIFLGIFIIFSIYTTKIRYSGIRFSIILIPLIMFFASAFFKKNKYKIMKYLYYTYFYISVIIAVKGLFSQNPLWYLKKHFFMTSFIYYMSIYIIFLILVILISLIIKKIKKS